MKKIVFLLLILNIALSSAIFYKQRLKRRSRDASDSILHSLNETLDVEANYFLQKLDHFNQENNQIWFQRYWNSTTYYESGGPVFLMVNGEVPVDDDSPFRDSMILYAEKLHALCFSLEHRYYGESWPGNENLRYLSTAQALADIAKFIKTMNAQFNLPKNTKWILFGCSYAGTLAAWARLKYPHLIHGAVASSAPLEFSVSSHDYYRVVEDTFKSYNSECFKSITLITDHMADLINGTENATNFSHIFRFAKNVLFEMVDILGDAAQYNDTTEINIPTICNIMINHNGTKLDALAELRRRYTISQQNDNDDDSSANRSWDYQICSELGAFQIYDKTPFLSALSHLLPIEGYIKSVCEQFFGPNFGINEMNAKLFETNTLYGGLDFNVRNTLFIHGSTDPWHTSGLYRQRKGALYETIFIKGGSHCSDTNSASIKKIPELENVHKRVLEKLKKWLKK